MVCYWTVLLALVALLLAHCDARTSPILLDERMDNCPCTLEMGGRANNPDKVYMEIDEVTEHESSSKCTLRRMAPVLTNHTKIANPFCFKAQVNGKGSYFIRACIAEDDDSADMELYNVNRGSCSSDDSHDEIQNQEDIDCDDSCSSRCDDSLDPSPAPTDFPNRPTISQLPRPSTVQSTDVVLSFSRLFRSLVRKVLPVSRIIDGAIVTDEDKLSYVVRIRHFESTISRTGYNICTGSLISERWVLTAGHCNNQRGDVVVIGERFDRNDGDVAKEKGESYVVKNVVFHPKFNETHNPRDPSIIGVNINDIALLELERDVDEADKIIHLNTDYKYPLPCSHARFSGHGKACADVGSETHHVLRTTVSRVVDIETCHKILERLDKCFTDNNSRVEPYLCALHDECNQGLCYGDSGGPLVMQRKRIDDDGEDYLFSMDDSDDTIQVQVGVASWIIDECGLEKRPDVFEPVSVYVVWINETTNGEAKFYPPLDKIQEKTMNWKNREVHSEVANCRRKKYISSGATCPPNVSCFITFPARSE